MEYHWKIHIRDNFSDPYSILSNISYESFANPMITDYVRYTEKFSENSNFRFFFVSQGRMIDARLFNLFPIREIYCRK